MKFKASIFLLLSFSIIISCTDSFSIDPEGRRDTLIGGELPNNDENSNRYRPNLLNISFGELQFNGNQDQDIFSDLTLTSYQFEIDTSSQFPAIWFDMEILNNTSDSYYINSNLSTNIRKLRLRIDSLSFADIPVTPANENESLDFQVELYEINLRETRIISNAEINKVIFWNNWDTQARKFTIFITGDFSNSVLDIGTTTVVGFAGVMEIRY